MLIILVSYAKRTVQFLIINLKLKHMNRFQISGIFERKTSFNRNKIEKLSLRENKIEMNYFKSIIKEIAEKCRRSGFTADSSFWSFLNRKLKSSDIFIKDFIDFFAASPKDSAIIRARLMKPPISRTLVKQFIAECLEIDYSELKEEANITGLVPKSCGQDYNSYLTLIIWCEEMFQKSAPKELAEKGTLKQLIDFFVDE